MHGIGTTTKLLLELQLACCLSLCRTIHLYTFKSITLSCPQNMVLPFPKEKFPLKIQGWLFSMFAQSGIFVFLNLCDQYEACCQTPFPNFFFGKGKSVGKHGNFTQALRLTPRATLPSREGMDLTGRQRTSVLQQPPSCADRKSQGREHWYHQLYHKTHHQREAE